MTKLSKDIQKFVILLSKLRDFYKIISLFKSKYSVSQQFIFERLLTLKQMVEYETEDELSLESLKGLLCFLYLIKDFNEPVISINDSGDFQLNWHTDRNNLLTLSFKENYVLHYVIFTPSSYTFKRIIFNGQMDIIDFKDYLIKLDIKLHIENNEIK